MDKRSSPRYAVELNALVHPNVGRSWLCQIQDFCDAGMLLVEQNGRPRRTLPGINTGEDVGIHFSVPTDTKGQHFRLEGRIVRLMDTGIGINFSSGMADDAFAALSDYSGLKPAKPEVPEREAPGETEASGGGGRDEAAIYAQGGLKPDDARKIVAALRKEVAQIIPEMASSLFTYMDSELLELAKDAKSNSEQSEYFAAMATLEKAKKEVNQQFLNDVLNQINEPRDLQTLLEERKKANDERKAQSQQKIKLSLVNTEEFEDWLAVANIIQRSERMYEKFLSELQQRMGMIVDSWGHAEANPLGTAVISHAFDSAIQNIDLSKDIRQKVYSGYESKVLPLFRKLYINSTRLMEESGIFPELDEDYVTPVRTRKPQAEESVAEEPVAEEPAEEIEEEVGEELRESARESARQEVGAAGQQSPGRSSRRRRRRAEPVDDDRPAETTGIEHLGDAIRSIYSSLRDLVGARGGYEEEALDEDADYFEEEEVHDLLNTLEDEMLIQHGDERMPVRQRLMETANLIDGRRVAPETVKNLEVVEKLVDTIEDDSMLTPGARDWIRQLEFTLDKVATRDEAFLSEKNPHQSLQLINQLASLGGAESGSARRAVDQIIRDVNAGFDDNPEVFDDALTKLQPLVDRQKRAFTGNVQRTVKTSQGQQTLHNAQRAVVSEMDNRYAGREVPEILYKLLMPGWRNLLVNTHLRQGESSPEWKKHIRALDQVFQYLDPESNPEESPGYMDPEELIAHIEAGLDSIFYEPGQRMPLVNSLKQVISGGGALEELPKVSFEESSIAENLGFSDVTEREEARSKIREENADDLTWQRSFDKAQYLHVGAWFEFLMKAEPEICIVAWISEEATQFVFVNRLGVKTHDLAVEELATLMHQGQVRILEDADIPLTDRASHRMLQNMHNQLTHQATHDDLTGLLNRKEFERELEKALDVAKRNDSVHLCACMDLDQFKVVNTAGGHDAGDRLLVMISALLTEKLSGEEAKLSRLGSDEFGLLIMDCDAERGDALVKSITDAVRALRFEWGADTFSLTVSCGLYYMNRGTEAVNRVMTGADAACMAAKDAGRDRVQQYKEDDSEMEHRKGIMEFVSQIDNALDNDRFVLNCQMIKPIEENNPDVHYEILLTVLDENGEPMPPQDFIAAAERYNRMGALDRWVIRNSFEFIAGNIRKLEDLGAFSINISGNSLTEPGFMEFVLEQFNETRLPTSKVCFEITETSAVGNLDDVVEFMEKMQIIGVRFSLDDFGTGLSSYSYLRNLPVDYVKIDGIFVKDIKESSSDYAVVKSINEIGHFMGKKTIAEYVEDDEVVEILREIGVDYAQGFGIGRKMPIVNLLD